MSLQNIKTNHKVCKARNNRLMMNNKAIFTYDSKQRQENILQIIDFNQINNKCLISILSVILRQVIFKMICQPFQEMLSFQPMSITVIYVFLIKNQQTFIDNFFRSLLYYLRTYTISNNSRIKSVLRLFKPLNIKQLQQKFMDYLFLKNVGDEKARRSLLLSHEAMICLILTQIFSFVSFQSNHVRVYELKNSQRLQLIDKQQHLKMKSKLSRMLEEQKIMPNTILQNIPLQKIDQQLISRYQLMLGSKYINKKRKQFQNTNFEAIFQKKGIKYDAQAPLFPQMSLEIIQESINSEVIVLNAQWGKFSMKFRILNVEQKSKIHHQQCDQGAYGSIYHVSIDKKPFVIKCILFQKLKDVGSSIIMAIKQYFLLRIASALQIGPYIIDNFMFDFILREHCIEFLQEACDKVSQINCQVQQQLKHNIVLMHYFKIIHFDIKIENIMRSNRFSKAIFIDFGLSDLVSVNLGQKMETFFRGTLLYCSEEMIKTFEASDKRDIDVYFNDIYCYEKSLKVLKKSNQFEDEEEGNYQNPEFYEEEPAQNEYHVVEQTSFLLFKIKYHLFQRETHILTRLFETNKQKIEKKLITDILSFFYELEPCEILRVFYRNYIKSHKKEGIDFVQINQVYSAQSAKLKSILPIIEKKNIFKEYYRSIISLTKQDEVKSFTQDKILALLSKQRNQQLKIQFYFSLYLKYISYFNNIYLVSEKKRIQITQLLYKNGYLKYEYPNLDYLHEQQLIQSTIILILKHTLLKMNKQRRQAPRLTKSLIFDLIEHIFIIDCCSKDELIQLLDAVYVSKLNHIDLIELVFKIKHNLNWLLYRYKNKFPSNQQSDQEEGSLNKYLVVKEWCFAKIIELRQINSTFLWVIQSLNEGWIHGSIMKVKSTDKKLNHLPKFLHFQFKLDLLVNQLIFTTPEQFQNRLNFIYDFIPNDEKSRLYFFHFIVYERQVYEFSSKMQSQSIERLFVKNLQSDQIMDSLMLKNISTAIFDPKADTFLEVFTELIQNLDFASLMVKYAIVERGLQSFSQLKKLNSQKMTLYKRCIKKLQVIMDWLQLKKLFNFCSKQSLSIQKRHRCLKFTAFQFLMKIKALFFWMTNKNYCFYSSLKEFADQASSLQCHNCLFILNNLVALEGMNVNLYRLQPKTLKQSQIFEQDFISQSNKLLDYQDNFKQMALFQHFRRAHLFQLYFFCTISYQLEFKYKGIRRLYFYLKEQKSIQDFLKKSDFHSRLLSFTFKALSEHEPIEELSIFLSELSHSLAQNYSLEHYQILKYGFINFLRKLYCNFDVNGLIYQLHKMSEDSSTNPFNVIYFLAFLPLLKRGKLQNQQIVKIAKLLHLLPFQARRRCEADLYRFIITNNIITEAINEANFNFPKRRLSFLRVKMLKNMKHQNRQIIDKRYKSSSQIHQSNLSKKAIQLGGPYDLQIQGFRKVYVKVIPKVNY